MGDPGLWFREEWVLEFDDEGYGGSESRLSGSFRRLFFSDGPFVVGVFERVVFRVGFNRESVNVTISILGGSFIRRYSDVLVVGDAQ